MTKPKRHGELVFLQYGSGLWKETAGGMIRQYDPAASEIEIPVMNGVVGFLHFYRWSVAGGISV